MIEKEKSFLKTEETEEVSKKPLSDEELSSLIKASNNSKFNEVEMKVKKSENESFKKIALHDIAKQINQQNREKPIKIDKTSDLTQPKVNEKEKEEINEKKDENINKGLTENKDNNENIINDLQENVKNEQDKAQEKKNIDEDEHFKILEKEKQIAYEKGKTDALNEIKEGSDAAIGQLKRVIDSFSKVDALDLKSFEETIENKVVELVVDLTGKLIKELPKEFVIKIKDLLSQLENIEGNVEIFINEEDYNAIEKNKNIKNEIKKLNINPAEKLKHGEIELRVNGITIRKIIK